MSTPPIPIESIQALRLQPGDVLAFRLNGRLLPEQLAYLRSYLKGQLPEGVKVLLLDHHIEIDPIHSVIQQKDLQP